MFALYVQCVRTSEPCRVFAVHAAAGCRRYKAQYLISPEALFVYQYSAGTCGIVSSNRLYLCMYVCMYVCVARMNLQAQACCCCCCCCCFHCLIFLPLTVCLIRTTCMFILVSSKIWSGQVFHSRFSSPINIKVLLRDRWFIQPHRTSGYVNIAIWQFLFRLILWCVS